jgi:hypothetical protein
MLLILIGLYTLMILDVGSSVANYDCFIRVSGSRIAFKFVLYILIILTMYLLGHRQPLTMMPHLSM